MWHVIYTKPRWEKKIYGKLLQKGYEVWCPMQKVERQWSDRKKVVEDVIFKSYLFAHITPAQRTYVLANEGVLNFVHFLGKPAIVRNEEIETMKAYLMHQDAKITLQARDVFEANTKIRVRQGVFMDQKGKVIKAVGKKKVYVSLESFGHVMIVEFPSDHLQTMEE